MTVWDKVLITVVLAVSIASGFLVRSAVGVSSSADTVIIRVDGAVRERLPLNRDTVKVIQGDHGFCRLEIKDGRARISKADCPNRLCVSQRPVDAEGGTIVCLPNKIVVTASGGGGAVDSVDAAVR